MNEERRPVQSAEPSHEADRPQEMVVASGISLRFWRLYAQAWLVCLLFPILSLVQLRPEPLRLLIAVAGLVIFVICYTWVMSSHPMHMAVRGQAPLQRTAFLVAGLTVLVLILGVLYGSAFLWLLIGVGAIAGVTLPLWIAFWTVMALTLLTLVASVVLSGGTAADWLHIIPLVLLVRGLGLDMIGLARFSGALREVHAARGELARYAVMEERLRVARDLHDLLGHTLSLIVLKSELARRVAEQDPHRAAQEIHEVERVARQSLLEVREAVAGYRQPVLESELDGARQVFDAAGIECAIEQMAGKLPQAIDAVLAWTVREGVTNIIRHSRAHHCTICVNCEPGIVRVEITNDGYWKREPSACEQLGSGLSGLTERVSACGGRLEAGPDATGGKYGFRLLVELPTSDQVIRKQELLQ